jgi:hypothetical protein
VCPTDVYGCGTKNPRARTIDADRDARHDPLSSSLGGLKEARARARREVECRSSRSLKSGASGGGGNHPRPEGEGLRGRSRGAGRNGAPRGCRSSSRARSVRSRRPPHAGVEQRGPGSSMPLQRPDERELALAVLAPVHQKPHRTPFSSATNPGRARTSISSPRRACKTPPNSSSIIGSAHDRSDAWYGRITAISTG